MNIRNAHNLILGALFLLLLTSCSKSENISEEDNISMRGTITHPLQIGKSPTVNLVQNDLNRILQDGSNLISQCNAVFAQQGAIKTINDLPSSINSSTDMARACSLSFELNDDVLPAGAPRKLQVVNAIRWCGSPGANIIGCAYTPGNCMVVRRFDSSQEGILLAHEFGHSKGLPHRNVEDGVMNATINKQRVKLNSAECNRFRQIGLLTEKFTYPKEHDIAETKIPIKEFVQKSFTLGMPYNQARLYTAVEVASVSSWLVDKARVKHWSNVASVIGMVASQQSYQQLYDFIFSEGSGKLTSVEYEARVTAIISMGYILKNRNDVATLTFLNDYSIPIKWNTVEWYAPYHATQQDQNLDLASASKIALQIAKE